jgi:hypothetical protein
LPSPDGRWPTNLSPSVSLFKVIGLNFNRPAGCTDDT